jgi:hypothetical protein
MSNSSRGNPHCTENSKHIFPEMKLRGLIPNFYFHVSGSDLHVPMIRLIWNLYFPVLRERAFRLTAGAGALHLQCRDQTHYNLS